MLKQISISNFAIIDKTTIDFDSDLTVITGQTGAGKSIVIDAIEQLLGARASANMVGNTNDFAFIEGVFEYSDHVSHLLVEENIEIDDEYLIINKKIKKDGKSQLRINNRIVTNDLVKRIGTLLVEIHSQHATYLLNDQVNQQSFVDNLLNDEEKNKLKHFKKEYKSLIKLEDELNDFTNNVVDPELLSFYQDQLSEINDNNIDDDEVEQLTQKEAYYKEFEKISTLLESAIQLFNNGILENMSDITNNIDKLSIINDQYQALSEKGNDIYYNLQDYFDLIKNDYMALSFDEQEYNLIKERLFNYNKMIKKYSYSQEEVQHKISDLENKINYINNSDYVIKELENKINNLRSDLKEKGKELDKIRYKYITKITKDINKHLSSLYFNDAQFEIKLEPTSLSSNGVSKVTFLFNANKGGKLQPLNAVASGGELSRLMLALKTIDAANSNKMYIFDEIDTGVSGQVADAIGNKIAEIAKNNVVICITHLPQVAVYGNNHLFIEKDKEKGFTTSNTYYLNEDERINEIAAMLSGDNVSKSAFLHAKELIENAKH